MKKENESLNHKVFILIKEKDELFSTLSSTQKDFDDYKISCKGKFSQIDENEISILKEKIDSLGVVLKKCEFDKARLDAMFSKKHVPKKHSHAIHTHAHKSQPLHHAKHPKHAHTPHNIMHSCMAKYFHAHIVAVKVIWLNFAMIELMHRIIMFEFGILTFKDPRKIGYQSQQIC